jgi:homoserine O-succinyltransferase/O-acetyltransferase
VFPAGRVSLEIGLLNNLSDAGLVGGERQFVSLLEEAAGNILVRLRLYSLPEIPRSPSIGGHMQGRYQKISAALSNKLDGFIVTGCEPSTGRLSDEPFWSPLTAVIDWAEHNTVSTLWSCLATHAAVLHLDGIERHRLDSKRSGIFSFDVVHNPDLPVSAGPLRHVPHSRFNDLHAGELQAHGYQVVASSPTAGVDLFTKRWRSLFVYMQGHPEYDEGALAREYRRDVLRFLRGASDRFPEVPQNYFALETENALRRFERVARETRALDCINAMPADASMPAAAASLWRRDAVALVRCWLTYLVENKG